jgi:hypothetical protein
MKLSLLLSLLSVTSSLAFEYTVEKKIQDYDITFKLQAKSGTPPNDLTIGGSLNGIRNYKSSVTGNPTSRSFGVKYTLNGQLPESCAKPTYSKDMSIRAKHETSGIDTDWYSVSNSQSSGYEWNFDYVNAVANAAGFAGKTALKATGLKGKFAFFLDDIFADGYSFAVLLSLEADPSKFEFKHAFNLAHDFPIPSNSLNSRNLFIVNCTNRCSGENAALCFRVGSGKTQLCSTVDADKRVCNNANSLGYGKGVTGGGVTGGGVTGDVTFPSVILTAFFIVTTLHHLLYY